MVENNIQISLEHAEKFYENLQSWGLISDELQEKFLNTLLENLRPKMHWVQKSTPYAPAARFYCSNCGNDEMYKTPFCPICGAMEVKDD